MYKHIVYNALQYQAAVLHNQEHEQNPTKYPKMIWPSNYFKLACSTMFTLFWAGDDFAPHFTIDGGSAQDYLQGDKQP